MSNRSIALQVTLLIVGVLACIWGALLLAAGIVLVDWQAIIYGLLWLAAGAIRITRSCLKLTR